MPLRVYLEQLGPKNVQAISTALQTLITEEESWGLTIVSEATAEGYIVYGPIPFPWKVVELAAQVSEEGFNLRVWQNGGLTGLTFATLLYENRFGPASSYSGIRTPTWVMFSSDKIVLKMQGSRFALGPAMSVSSKLVLYDLRYEFCRLGAK